MLKKSKAAQKKSLHGWGCQAQLITTKLIKNEKCTIISNNWFIPF